MGNLNGPQRMSKLLFFGAAVVGAALVGWIVANHGGEARFEAAAAPQQMNAAGSKRVVHLYFADAQGRYLMAEQRILEAPPDRPALAKRLIELLVQGPRQGATRTLPAEARISAVYISKTGTAYVDFAAGSFARHPGGIRSELLSIYSVVNSLVLNVDGVRSVKFLIGGREAATLAGHADLRASYDVDMLWVR